MHYTSPTPYTTEPWKGRTVGLLGGSFNPAHDGHRHISLYALKMLGLDAVWWMVSPQNPLKTTAGMAPLETRVREAQQVSNHPKIVVTDIERHLNTRYTADTLRKLQKLFPDTRFVWLMGTDNLRQFHKWQEWQSIFQHVPVCVLDRPPRGNSIRACKTAERFRPYLLGQEKAMALKTTQLPAWTILHIPLSALSATEIRQKRAKKT